MFTVSRAQIHAYSIVVDEITPYNWTEIASEKRYTVQKKWRGKGEIYHISGCTVFH